MTEAVLAVASLQLAQMQTCIMELQKDWLSTYRMFRKASSPNAAQLIANLMPGEEISGSSGSSGC